MVKHVIIINNGHINSDYFYINTGILSTNNIYSKDLLSYAIEFVSRDESADFFIEFIKLNCENSCARYFLLQVL